MRCASDDGAEGVAHVQWVKQFTRYHPGPAPPASCPSFWSVHRPKTPSRVPVPGTDHAYGSLYLDGCCDMHGGHVPKQGLLGDTGAKGSSGKMSGCSGGLLPAW